MGAWVSFFFLQRIQSKKKTFFLWGGGGGGSVGGGGRGARVSEFVFTKNPYLKKNFVLGGGVL